jgi:sterol 3beta-glucosyltransferase
MQITVLAIGTRGDVQPLLALALGLQRTGRHRVRFAAPDDFGALVREHGVDFFPLGMNARELLGTGDLRAGLESGRSTILWVWQILQTMQPLFERLKTNTWLACRGAETIVFSTMGFGAYHVAEKLGVPACWAIPFPALARTRAFPSVACPQLRLGGTYNLWTHVLAEQFLQALTRRFINRWRREQLHLPAIPPGKWPYSQLNGRPLPMLYSFSPVVVPKPPDWGAHTHITGYWLLDPAPDWQPPARLVDFLNSGPPPVYIGFGSMAHRTPRQTTRLVATALKIAGQRGVLVTGWGGLSVDLDVERETRFSMRWNIAKDLVSTGLFTMDAVPHAWLFPRTAAVVHHGGSGTTGAGLRAGTPSVLVPHTGDQPLWARRVTELGVGPRPVPRRRLTAERLAAAITSAVTDQGMRTRAAALGERIRAEDGIGRAIEVIEGL